jgi:hypothetical protein
MAIGGGLADIEGQCRTVDIFTSASVLMRLGVCAETAQTPNKKDTKNRVKLLQKMNFKAS